MADRSAARAFGAIFKILAEDPYSPNKHLAQRIAKIAWDGDFSIDQMDCWQALCKLGLAREATTEEKIEDGMDEDSEHYIDLF